MMIAIEWGRRTKPDLKIGICGEHGGLRADLYERQLFWIVCAIWGLALAFVGAVGISWLGWLSSWLPIFPLLVIIIAGFSNISAIFLPFRYCFSLPDFFAFLSSADRSRR
jgi:amino acid transporter